MIFHLNTRLSTSDLSHSPSAARSLEELEEPPHTDSALSSSAATQANTAGPTSCATTPEPPVSLDPSVLFLSLTTKLIESSTIAHSDEEGERNALKAGAEALSLGVVAQTLNPEATWLPRATLRPRLCFTSLPLTSLEATCLHPVYSTTLLGFVSINQPTLSV